ncbi:MAG: WYL domain-containing protein [Deltaproteobacteria bacterium]|nr:WYL domain-containing protein [Deltaproteobacteria bacterium]
MAETVKKVEVPRTERVLRILNRLFTAPTKKLSLNSLDEETFGKRDTIRDCVSAIQNHIPGLVEIRKGDNGEKTLFLLPQKNKFNLSPPDINSLMRGDAPDHLRLALALNDLELGPETKDLAYGLLDAYPDKKPTFRPLPQIVKLRKGRVALQKHQKNIDIICEAITENKVCQFMYRGAYDRNDRETYFGPRQLLSHNGLIYVEGYRFKMARTNLKKDIGEERTMAIHRIKGEVRITELEYPKKIEIKPIRANQDCFGMIDNEPFNLDAKFAPELKNYLEERSWPTGTELTAMKGDHNTRFRGWMKLKMRCGDKRETLSWLFGFGSRVVINHPKKLKELYCDELIKIGKNLPNLKITKKKIK